jgi:hypothetical protein
VTVYGLGMESEPLIGSWRDLLVLLTLGWLLLVLAGAAVPPRPATHLPWVA